MVLQWKLGKGRMMSEINHEEIEWGIKRKPLYERQRNALREMEETKNERNNKCSFSDAGERSYQV